MLSGQRGATKEFRTGGIISPSVEVVLVGEVGRVGVSSGRDARGAGEEVADVGVERRGGRGVALKGVRTSRGAAGLVVQQGAGGAGRGRRGRSHVKHLSLAQLDRGDVLALLGGEKGFGGRQRV